MNDSDLCQFFAWLSRIFATVCILVAVYTIAFSPMPTPTPAVSCVIDDGDDYSPPDESAADTGGVR